ncbi:MAG: hypothetical protein ACK5N8_07720 [Alphaproteobacteria bacterium]
MKKQLKIGIVGCSSYILENMLDIFSVRSDVVEGFRFLTKTGIEKEMITKHLDNFSLPSVLMNNMSAFLQEIDILIIGSNFKPDAEFMRKVIQNQIHIFIEGDFDFCESAETYNLYDLSVLKKVVIVKNNSAKYHIGYKNLENIIKANERMIKNIQIDILHPPSRFDNDPVIMKKIIHNRLIFFKKIYKEEYTIISKNFDKKFFLAKFKKADVEIIIKFNNVFISSVTDHIKYKLEDSKFFDTIKSKEIYSMTSLSHLVHNFIYRVTSGILTDKDELVFPSLLD